ncbi:MAG: acylphosphatase [Nitrospira sp.]|nr:acylphosphatase [Nitrospira sp.]
MIKQLHLYISGRVQGVFYRASTRDMAVRLGLKGWVRNLPDGYVEAVFEGTEDELQEAIQWCQKGPPGAHVLDIKEKWSDTCEGYKSFDIKY